MDRGDTFFNEHGFKPKLTAGNPSAQDLKRYLLIVFGTYKQASQAIGVSESRLHQLFMGYALPQNPDIIKRISRGWGVDIVVLTQVFEELRRMDNDSS